MSTPFWQIRNKSFLTAKPQQMGSISAAKIDMLRDMKGIYINNKSLWDILIERTHANKDSTEEEIMLHIDENTTDNLIKDIFKEELLQFCESEQTRDKFAEKLGKVLYQYGLIYACSQAFKDNPEVGDKGYLLTGENLKTKVHIYAKSGGIFVEELGQLNSISKLEYGERKENGMPATPKRITLSNPDSTPLVTFKNQFHIKPEGEELAFRHTDLAINYKNPTIESLYDKRNLGERIRDFFKSILRMNEIKDFSLDDEQFIDEDKSSQLSM